MSPKQCKHSSKPGRVVVGSAWRLSAPPFWFTDESNTSDVRSFLSFSEKQDGGHPGFPPEVFFSPIFGRTYPSFSDRVTTPPTPTPGALPSCLFVNVYLDTHPHPDTRLYTSSVLWDGEDTPTHPFTTEVDNNKEVDYTKWKITVEISTCS